MGEHGEALENKLMLVVFDDRRCLGEKIRRRTDCYPIVMQFIRVIRVQFALVYYALAGVNAVPYAGST